MVKITIIHHQMISLSTTRRYWEYMKLGFKSCLPIKTKIDNPTGIIIQWWVTHIASRPPLRWLVYTVMELIEKSSYSTFSKLRLELQNQRFVGLLTDQTSSSIPVKYQYIWPSYGHFWSAINMSVFDRNFFYKAILAQQGKVLRVKNNSKYI